MLKAPDDKSKQIHSKAEQFNAEYDSLEYLLVAIMDGARRQKDRARQTNLAAAYKALTGKDRKRVDTPDSEVGMALVEYMYQGEINQDNYTEPEFGGTNNANERPYLEVNGVANLAVVTVGERSGNLLPYVSERIHGTYKNKMLQADPEGYWQAQLARYRLHDRKSEAEFYKDMATVAGLLRKHKIELDLSRPFWRTQQK